MMHQFSISRSLQPTLLKNLYMELDLISQFEKRCHEIRCSHAKSSDFQWKFKTKKYSVPLGIAPILDSFFSLMFSHSFISSFREVKQCSAFRTKTWRIGEKRKIIYEKHFLYHSFILLRISCGVIIISNNLYLK